MITAIVLGTLLRQAPTLPPPSAPIVSLGGNLEGIADWSFSNIFADLVKQSRGFANPQTPWTGTVQLDSNGWPLEDFGVILATWTGMKNVGGDYKISCQCATTPTIQLVASPGTIENESRDPSTGLVTADIIYPEGGSQLMLSFTNTSGGVKNLHVMRPGYAATTEFTNPILRQLENFSTLRFMDFENTNGNPDVNWSDRTPASAPTYAAGNSVPWERCIDLCNLLGKDAWINVPHMATNAYVASLAHLFHTNLKPGLHVYVEYSNEVWNWGFVQATWNLNQAKADVAAGDPDLNYDNINDPYTWAARRIAKRIKTISDQFKAEYGNNFQSTVRPVLATQIAWPAYWLVDGLNFLNARYGPPDAYLYACAGAPYFNLGDANSETTLTEEQVIQALTASVDEMSTDLNMDACATLSRYNNLKFLAYEGGPDTFGPNDITAKAAAMADPQMRSLSDQYLKIWLGYGFDLFNWYTAGASNYTTQYGTWGITDDMQDSQSQKLLAIQDTKALQSITLNQGTLVPGLVDARRFAFRDATWQTEGILNLNPTDWRGNYRDYLVRTNAAGTRTIRLKTATTNPGVSINVFVNNVLVGPVEMPVTGSDNTYTLSATLSAPMTQGMNVIRIQLRSGQGGNVSAIAVQ